MQVNSSTYARPVNSSNAPKRRKLEKTAAKALPQDKMSQLADSVIQGVLAYFLDYRSIGRLSLVANKFVPLTKKDNLSRYLSCHLSHLIRIPVRLSSDIRITVTHNKHIHSLTPKAVEAQRAILNSDPALLETAANECRERFYNRLRLLPPTALMYPIDFFQKHGAAHEFMRDTLVTFHNANTRKVEREIRMWMPSVITWSEANLDQLVQLYHLEPEIKRIQSYTPVAWNSLSENTPQNKMSLIRAYLFSSQNLSITVETILEDYPGIPTLRREKICRFLLGYLSASQQQLVAYMQQKLSFEFLKDLLRLETENPSMRWHQIGDHLIYTVFKHHQAALADITHKNAAVRTVQIAGASVQVNGYDDPVAPSTTP